MTTDRTTTAREARRLLVERVRADREFAEALIADPPAALADIDLAALSGVPGEETEVEGFWMRTV